MSDANAIGLTNRMQAFIAAIEGGKVCEVQALLEADPALAMARAAGGGPVRTA